MRVSYSPIQFRQTVLDNRPYSSIFAMSQTVPPPVPPAASRTRVETVMDTLRARIASRALMPGARVPSIRMMADSLGVSKSTV
ncbi:GntR family transcriptional regulator, partial [Escherichia coli]|uniref:GntR family transcriptional regulator n=1 Tax=Escherichia coli TaxID=562 RepID=UPI0019D70CDA